MSNQKLDEVNETVLLAEDQPEDVICIQHAFSKSKFLNPLKIVPTGQEAIAYLHGAGKYANRSEYPLPSLLLLDLNLPGHDGFEVLAWIRKQPRFDGLRVVVLTAWDHLPDVNRAYQLGANSFLVKPIDFSHFVEMTQSLKGYWMWVANGETPDEDSPLSKIQKLPIAT